MKSFRWVQDRLREIVQQNPDRYAGCTYFDPAGQPNCVVGHVLHELGVDADAIEALEGVPAQGLDWAALGVRNPGSKQSRWIACLQDEQDGGASWSDALAAAEAVE